MRIVFSYTRPIHTSRLIDYVSNYPLESDISLYGYWNMVEFSGVFVGIGVSRLGQNEFVYPHMLDEYLTPFTVTFAYPTSRLIEISMGLPSFTM